MGTFISTSEQETARIAADMARNAVIKRAYLLSGPLGAGKSVFARAFIRELCGPDTDVPSPTFTLVQMYECEKGTVWHYDLYRLSHPDEVYNIGWEDALSEGIVLVEWPERLGALAPEKVTRIAIETLDGESRRITVDD